MNDDELVPWLRLARTPGIGPAQFFKLLDTHKTPRAALEWLGSPQGLAKTGIERLHRTADALDELQGTQDLGGGLITFACPTYPDLLRQIPDPPPLISYLGDPGWLTQTSIAIVGARNASGNGRKLAFRLAADVAKAEFCVTSGLARGIDTAAHQGALTGAGSTIAVIASGIDIAYPSENRGLMDQISQSGLVVSERPLGAAPLARHFPRRNRIISGLSRAIVVVEAAEKSGSLMTARLGLEHGREVMAVPGSPMDPRHRGTNRLLRDGAQMVEEAVDILQNLPSFIRQPLPKNSAPPRPRPARKTRAEITSKPAANAGSELSSRIEELLSAEPLAVDELIRQCHGSTNEVQDLLLQLEMDGRISRHPGNRVALDLS